MLNSDLLSSVTRICEQTERQLAELDNMLYLNKNKNSTTKQCEYCESLARKSAELKLQREREQEMLLQEVEKALQLAASAYATEAKLTKPKHLKKSVPEKIDSVTSVSNSCNSGTRTLRSRTPLQPNAPERRTLPLRQPLKVNYIPAHHKAPYKTEPCKSNAILRKQARPPSRAPAISQQYKCSKFSETLITKPTSNENIDASIGCTTIPQALLNPSVYLELPVVKNSSEHGDSNLKSKSFVDSVSREEPKAGNREHLTNSNCVCKQKIRAELERYFLIAMRRLLQTVREYRPISKVANTEDISRGFYLQFLQGCDSSIVNSCFHRKCGELARLTDKFCQYLSCLDSESTDSNQREWIHRVMTRILTLHRYMHSVYTNISRDEFHKQSPSSKDVVGQWIAETKGKTSYEPSKSYDNPLLESYLAIGPPPSKYTPSRLFTLTSTPELCVFDGSQQDVARFLLLWSELELINVETKLFNELCERLPQIKMELENNSKNRASTFREVYGLICGTCPIALKDSFGS